MFDPFRRDLLAGKTTIITGGGTGLGRAMALRMAGLGAKVGVLGRRPEPLQETAKAIRDAGGAAVGVPCDVRDPVAVAAAFDGVETALGPANQLINNAAGNFLAASEDLSANAFNSVVQIVLYGTFHCTTELGRRLIARKAKGETPRVGPDHFPAVPYPEPMIVPPPWEGGDGNSVAEPGARAGRTREAVAP